MWNRKELKEKAKETIKKSYWTIILVCFILTICTGEFGMSSTGIENNIEPISVEISGIGENLETPSKEIMQGIRANLNSALKSQKYMYKIVDAVYLVSNNSIAKGVALFVGAALAFLFIIFIADPLIVGGRRFFAKVRKDEKTKIGVLISIFKKDQWVNISKIMFLKNIYTALWYLTIIGGIIKTYEYKMIPYILAENPQIKTADAFKLTKQMMKGNKWKTFVLDISFLPWDILSIFTFGLLSILYVNPYIVATNTELYNLLKEEAIKNKYEKYELLEINEKIKKDNDNDNDKEKENKK